MKLVNIRMMCVAMICVSASNRSFILAARQGAALVPGPSQYGTMDRALGQTKPKLPRAPDMVCSVLQQLVWLTWTIMEQDMEVSINIINGGTPKSSI